MDSRRPNNSNAKPPRQPAKRTTAMQQSTLNFESVDSKTQTDIVEQAQKEQPPCKYLPKTSNVLGIDAILYDRSMLPQSMALLLDVLSAIEAAMALLGTRRIRPTFSAVKDVVAKSTRRDFTLTMLSQLAAILPEAIAVLPPPASASGKTSDNLIIRLDDVMQPTTSQRVEDSVLNDSQSRLRRSMLHKRLLAHVTKQHDIFLKRNGLQHAGTFWHEDFDLEKHVKPLPAPSLMRSLKVTKKAPVKSLKDKLVQGRKLVVVKETIPDDSSDEADDQDVAIPSSLLQRVRAREQAKAVHETKVQKEQATNETLLSKLPCTMDTISSLMRTERRVAMGWAQLLMKVERVHPSKWTKDDLEKQINAIVDLAPTWCKKVELKSSRGGFAFRIVSESAFGAAKAAVLATEAYPAVEENEVDASDAGKESSSV